MCIDISKLLQSDGARAVYKPESNLKSVSVGGTDYPVKIAEPIEITVLNKGNKVLEITYGGEASVIIPCARCLEDVEYPISFSGVRQADMKLPDEKRDETFFIIENKMYPDLLITDEILMRWPIRVLCKEDCKGICSQCGANLNYTQCGCEKEATDPRMAAIKDIFSQFKEV